MGILAKEIEHKLTQILLDCRREVLMNGKNLKSETGMIEEMRVYLDRLELVFDSELTQKVVSTKLIALLIQYQLKYL